MELKILKKNITNKKDGNFLKSIKCKPVGSPSFVYDSKTKESTKIFLFLNSSTLSSSNSKIL